MLSINDFEKELNSRTLTKKAAQGSGKYGFSKKVANGCEKAAEKLKHEARKIAVDLLAKDASEVVAFLESHARKGDGKVAKTLLAAISASVPPVSADILKPEAPVPPVMPAPQLPASTPPLTLPEDSLQEAVQGIQTEHSEPEFMGKTGSQKKAAYSMYGRNAGVVKNCLASCAKLSHLAGVLACNLQMKNATDHEKMSEFWGRHYLESGCQASNLLASTMADTGWNPNS